MHGSSQAPRYSRGDSKQASGPEYKAAGTGLCMHRDLTRMLRNIFQMLDFRQKEG